LLRIDEQFSAIEDFESELYGARLDLVNFGGEILRPSSIAEGVANSESLQDRAMRWDAKDPDEDSPNLTACRITQRELVSSKNRERVEIGIKNRRMTCPEVPK